MSGLSIAMMGDEAFFAAIEAADKDTFGTGCSNCGTYHIARISLGTDNAMCPVCGSKKGWIECPALGYGPSSIQKQDDDGGEIVLASLFFG
jgi:uncharacterized OB-fold protein